MPRVIQMPLSGGDRKAQAKELRRARGLHDEYMKQAAQVAVRPTRSIARPTSSNATRGMPSCSVVDRHNPRPPSEPL
jgi:hypothetical protein